MRYTEDFCRDITLTYIVGLKHADFESRLSGADIIDRHTVCCAGKSVRVLYEFYFNLLNKYKEVNHENEKMVLTAKCGTDHLPLVRYTIEEQSFPGSLPIEKVESLIDWVVDNCFSLMHLEARVSELAEHIKGVCDLAYRLGQPELLEESYEEFMTTNELSYEIASALILANNSSSIEPIDQGTFSGMTTKKFGILEKRIAERSQEYK